MSGTKRPDYFQTKTFLGNLKKIVTTLPTESEKLEIQKNLNELTEFLHSMQKVFEILPSIDDMSKVEKSIRSLEELLNDVKTNPTLANIFGLHRPSSSKRKKFIITDEEIAKAKEILTQLESISANDIRSRLQDDNLYSVSNLRAIASVMGIKSTEKLNRETLAHQITMKIANYRGYQQLSGQEDKQSF